MYFKMIKLQTGRRTSEQKNLETEEGSCLMETWKRRGEPEKKIVTETRKENISAKRKPDRSVRRDWQVKKELCQEKVIAKPQFHCSTGGRSVIWKDS